MGRRTVKSLALRARVACICGTRHGRDRIGLSTTARRSRAPDLVHSESGQVRIGRLRRQGAAVLHELRGREAADDPPSSGAKPKLVLDDIDAPGGIVFRRNGHVLVGYGDSIAQGSDGEANPEAGLIDVNPKTGSSRIYVDGLQMANGVTRGPGGQIFASTDFGTGVDRVLEGAVELAWAPLDSSNGMVVDRGKKHLFVNQTFTPSPTIARIPLDDPTAAVAWFTAPDEPGAFLDGLTRDADGNLYAAANGSGDVWKVSGRTEGCILWHGQPFPNGPSDVAFGRGKGRFPKGSLFVTTFGGELLQLRHAR